MGKAMRLTEVSHRTEGTVTNDQAFPRPPSPLMSRRRWIAGWGSSYSSRCGTAPGIDQPGSDLGRSSWGQAPGQRISSVSGWGRLRGSQARCLGSCTPRLSRSLRWQCGWSLGGRIRRGCVLGRSRLMCGRGWCGSTRWSWWPLGNVSELCAKAVHAAPSRCLWCWVLQLTVVQVKLHDGGVCWNRWYATGVKWMPDVSATWAGWWEVVCSS